MEEIIVSDDSTSGSTHFTSYNSMLFGVNDNAEPTDLLLVPEGMEGEAVLPETMATVPACAFSRCIKLSAISVANAGSTANSAFTSEDGILYTQDKATLVAAPVAIGASVKISPECASISEGAFWGNHDLATIVSGGSVKHIAPGTEQDGELIEIPAFNDDVIVDATVALIVSADDFDAAKAPWAAAGFTHFAEPAAIGDTQTPEEGSGFAYTLLDDYTLEVSWTGNDAPEAELIIPATAELSGVSYKVTKIADAGFANLDSIVTVETPASVIAIGTSAFDNCTSLKTATLNDAVRTIGARAFANTALTTFILPIELQMLGEEALANLDGATIVDITGTADIASDALAGTTRVQIYTPYRVDSEYAWKIGIPAASNQLLPYGVKLGRTTFDLEVGESARLFGGSGYVHTPGDVSIVCTYTANAMSIDPEQGKISALKEGGTHFVITLVLPLSIDGVSEPHQIELDITPQN